MELFLKEGAEGTQNYPKLVILPILTWWSPQLSVDFALNQPSPLRGHGWYGWAETGTCLVPENGIPNGVCTIGRMNIHLPAILVLGTRVLTHGPWNHVAVVPILVRAQGFKACSPTTVEGNIVQSRYSAVFVGDIPEFCGWNMVKSADFENHIPVFHIFSYLFQAWRRDAHLLQPCLVRTVRTQQTLPGRMPCSVKRRSADRCQGEGAESPKCPTWLGCWQSKVLCWQSLASTWYLDPSIAESDHGIRQAEAVPATFPSECQGECMAELCERWDLRQIWHLSCPRTPDLRW